MRSKGLNSEKTKIANRLGVLKLICTNSDISRTEIATKMGLTKMTVSTIVNNLISSDSVIEAESSEEIKKSRSNKRGAGRKRMELRLSETSPLVIGLFLSRVKCSGVLSTLDMKTLSKAEISLNHDETEGTLLEKSCQIIDDLLEKAGRLGRRTAAIGISSLGPLNASKGIILKPPNFYSIKNFEIVKLIQNRFKIPTYLRNDMDAGAISERHFGRCKEISDFVYVGLSHGVGAGIISDGELYSGSSGFAGEIGHVSINFNGPRCHCGNRGCLEAYISLDKLKKTVEKAYGIEISDFKDFWELENRISDNKKIVLNACDLIAAALINLCNTLDPKAIVLGHEAVYFTDSHIKYIEDKVNKGVLSEGVSQIKLYRSAFGENSAVYGAAVVGIERVFEGDVCYDEMFNGGIALS